MKGVCCGGVHVCILRPSGIDWMHKGAQGGGGVQGLFGKDWSLVRSTEGLGKVVIRKGLD